MATDTYTIKLKVEGNQLKKAIKEYKDNVKKANKETSKLEKNFDSFKKNAIGAVASVGLVTGAITKMVNEARKIEDMTAKFTTLTGSVGKAKNLVKDLTEFTARTPFQLESVSNAAKTLLAFGSTVEDVKPLLQDLGDIAAATGNEMNDIALVFGQVQAAGKLTGERYLQLAERGIVLKDVLAKQLGVSVERVRDEISKGNVSFSTFKEAITSLNEDGGLAAGGMARQAETLSGKLSTLTDNINLFFGALGSQKTGLLKTVTDEINKFFVALNQQVSETPLEKARNDLIDLQAELNNLDPNNDGIFARIIGTDFEAKREQLEAAIADAEVKFNDLLEMDKKAKEEEQQEEEKRLQRIENNKKKEQKIITVFDGWKMTQKKKMEEFEKKNEFEKAQSIAQINANMFGALASLAQAGGKDNFGIWKAFAVAQATTNAALAISNASTVQPWPLSIAAMTTAAIQGALNVRRVTMASPPAFANGGIVGGSSFTGDNVTAQVNSGEMVLNRQQQANLFQQVTSGAGGGDIASSIQALGDRIAGLEVVLRADDIEIARSVNRALNDGFVLGRS